MFVRPLACLTALTLLTTVSCGTPPETAKREAFDSGQRYFQQKKYPEAVIEFRKAIQADPNFGEARYRLAEVFTATGEAQKAYEEYVRAADLMPDNVDAQLQTAFLLMINKHFEDARTRAHKVVEKDATNVRGQILLSQSSAGLGEFDTAEQDLRQALTVSPGNIELQLTLGEILSTAGRKAQAEQVFRGAIASSPESSDARVALGKYLWSEGQSADAEQQFLAAVKSKPSDITANQTFAMFLLQSKRPAEAERYLKAAVDPARPSTQVSLADYYVSAGRIEEAKGVLAQVSAHAVGASDAKLRLAELNFADGHRAEARTAVDEVLAVEKANVRAMSLKARTLLEDGHPDDALKVARAAVATTPGAFEAHAVLGAILAAGKQVDEAISEYSQAAALNPRSATTLTELARLKLSKQLGDEAERLARQAVREDPTNVAARVVLVQALLATGNVASAEQESKPLDAITNVPQILVQRGLIALSRGNAAKSGEYFEQALKIAPDSAEALSGLVAVKLATRKPAEAEAAVNAHLAKNPDNPQLLVLAGRTYLALGKTTRAEEVLQHGIEEDSANLEAYSTLGGLYVQSGRIDRALAQYEAMAKTQPKSVAAQTMVGTLLVVQNKTVEARRSYQRALDIDPNAAVAANNLAWLQAQDGENLDVALDLAQVAKRQLPDSPSVNDTLGWIYYKKGLTSAATPFFEQAIAKDPKDPTYHYHLGLAQAEAGNGAQSRASFERALAIRSDFPGADAARKALGRSSFSK